MKPDMPSDNTSFTSALQTELVCDTNPLDHSGSDSDTDDTDKDPDADVSMQQQYQTDKRNLIKSQLRFHVKVYHRN